MRRTLIALLSALSLGVGTALSAAQTKSEPVKDSAPPQSSHAPGHDAQSGKPETAAAASGSGTGGERRSQDTGEANRAIAGEAAKQKK